MHLAHSTRPLFWQTWLLGLRVVTPTRTRCADLKRHVVAASTRLHLYIVASNRVYSGEIAIESASSWRVRSEWYLGRPALSMGHFSTVV